MLNPYGQENPNKNSGRDFLIKFLKPSVTFSRKAKEQTTTARSQIISSMEINRLISLSVSALPIHGEDRLMERIIPEI